MGFRHAGQHRTKAVQLWRHGDTRILVNHDPPASNRPRVAAIAVESADPIGSAQRAEALLAPVLPRDRGPGEADLTAIAAPDGTSVFFCRTDAADADSWVADFVTAGDAGAGTELTGIDHIALSQPFDYFDEAALFYRSVLGLELEDRAELAAPDGLVRSRAARSADGSVRFALSVPVVGRGAEIQHVAFACDDVFTCARAMRERGVPLLEIPGNYYDDLAARTDLEPAAIERMRELGVLYDGERRRRAPALLHRDGGLGVLRGARAARRLRGLRRGQLAGQDGRAAGRLSRSHASAATGSTSGR